MLGDILGNRRTLQGLEGFYDWLGPKCSQGDAEPGLFCAAIWEKSNDIYMFKCVNSWSILVRMYKKLLTVTESGQETWVVVSVRGREIYLYTHTYSMHIYVYVYVTRIVNKEYM